MKELLNKIDDAGVLRKVAGSSLDILSKVADYIGKVQPAVESKEAFEKSFQAEATKVAAVLADRNVISHAESAKLVEKLAENPLAVFNLVRNVSKAPAEQFAASADGVVDKTASAPEELDAFDRLAIYGDPNAGVRRAHTGMID